MARLKQLLQQNKLTRVFCLGQLCSPKFIELLSLFADYDAVWLDQEHGSVSTQHLEHATRAARATGIDTFVRLAPTDYAAVMRPLEAGAGGIMAAQVRNARQTEEIVRWTKFHPRGIRGINNTGVDGLYGKTPLAEYMQDANANTFIAVQIENSEAVQDVERIAAVKDLDLLFIGPADLSQSLGVPGEWDHPKNWKAIERVSQAAKAHGVHWGILPPSLPYARRCVEMGCKMLSLGIDVWVVQRGIRSFQGDYEEFFTKR
jgi:2-dehydro-3-deoxyglucarate aldolase/4-hydroxy-2-oxoheptanedioate aldolase